MNELDLIKEVEKRPILYDKSVSGFNKTKLRDDAWKEVQEALNVSEAECKKRWRSLRDSFIKLQRTHGGRTRWPYHIAMRFLLPHVEPKVETRYAQLMHGLAPWVKLQRTHGGRTRWPYHIAMRFLLPHVEPKVETRSPGSTHDISNDSMKKEDDSDPEEMEPQIRLRAMPSLPDLSFPSQDAKSYDEEDDDSQPSPKKMRLNSTDEEATSSCQCNRTDPDELFLLSCAPILKRLSAKQNAGARLKIQQVLYEAEFGANAPYVTPASECSFDPIDPVE